MTIKAVCFEDRPDVPFENNRPFWGGSGKAARGSERKDHQDEDQDGAPPSRRASAYVLPEARLRHAVKQSGHEGKIARCASELPADFGR